MIRVILGFMFALSFWCQSANAQSYIYPLYPSTTSSFQGYVRFINPVGAQLTFSVIFMDYGTQTVRGSCALTIPGFAAPQYPVSELEQCAGVTPSGSTPGILSFQTVQGVELFHQYVLWSSATGFFGQAGGCRTYGAPLDFAANVHTSSISGYMATVLLHLSTPLDYRIKADIYDQRTGAMIGTWTSPIYAQTTKVVNVAMSTLEAEGSWTVGTKPYHVNLKFTILPATSSTPISDAVHIGANLVHQIARGELYNLGTMCRD